MVSVTPEVSSSAVLTVGSGHGPMVVKASTDASGRAGDAPQRWARWP